MMADARVYSRKAISAYPEEKKTNILVGYAIELIKASQS